MKQIAVALCFVFFALQAFSQNATTDLHLRIEDDNQKPVSYTLIDFTDKTTGAVTKLKTDHLGKIITNVKNNQIYAVGFEGFPEYMTIAIPEKTLSYYTATVVFNPPTRSSVSFLPPDTIIQKLPKNVQPDNEKTVVKIKIVDLNMRALPNMTMSLFSQKQNKVFRAEDDGNGLVLFKIEPGNYLVSIGDLVNYQTVEIKHKQGLILTQMLRFVPTEIRETEQNDTITQRVDSYTKATSERVLVVATVKDFDKRRLEGEDVFLDQYGGNKVYKAVTDSRGEVRFLVPKGKRYTLNMQYERDIDIMDFPHVQGLRTSRYEFSYVGTATVQDFYQKTKRDSAGFLTEFMQSPIERLPFETGIFEKTEVGYTMNYPSKSAVATPAFGENQIFSGAGYYTANFYCFDALSGSYRWGAKFSDGGPSAAAYANGVVVVTTQSCTVYAIDAITGQLKWSKWLGPNIYSTPTIHNDMVIAVYPNDMDYRISSAVGSKRFAIVAFDIHTGKIIWQNWLDTEVMASAVGYKDKIYLTTQSGKFYAFDAQSGKQLKVIDNQFTTPPTITDKYIYLSKIAANDSTKEHLVFVNRTNLAITKEIKHISGTLTAPDYKTLSSFDQMNAMGSRILHYNKKNYNTIGGKLVCSNPETGAIIWSVQLARKGEVSNVVASMPIVTNNQIMVADRYGKITTYNPVTGQLINQYETHSQHTTHPIVFDGWIFAGSKNGKMIAIDTKNKAFTGWQMWGKDGSHNTAVE